MSSRRAHQRKRERQNKRHAFRPKPMVEEQPVARFKSADLFAAALETPLWARAFQQAIEEIQQT
jgi:hypothetical protein